MPDTNKETKVVYTSAYPITFPTVDILPYSEDVTKILLARKPGRTTWRMIGGFVDVNKDYSKQTGLEENAARELKEEAGLDIDKRYFKYLGSFYVNDLRYANSPNCIVTTVFKVEVTNAEMLLAKASDDIEEVRWFEIDRLPEIDADHKKFIDRISFDSF